MISKEDYEAVGFKIGRITRKPYEIDAYIKKLLNSTASITYGIGGYLIQESLGKDKWYTLYEGPIKDIKELKVILKKLLI